MSELTDLQAKFDKASTDVQKALTDAAAKLDALAAQIAGNPPPAELAAVAADISAQSDALEAAAAAMEAKVTGVPPLSQP